MDHLVLSGDHTSPVTSSIHKMKRPHSPEYKQSQYLSARNYKKQRLLEDFEQLLISPSRAKSSVYKRNSKVDDSLGAWKGSTDIVSANVRTDLQDFLQQQLKKGYSLTDANIINTIKRKIIESNLQLTKYVRWDLYIYELWKKWYFSRSSFYTNYGEEQMIIDDFPCAIENANGVDEDITMLDI